jgi:hypothetical protein
MSMTLIPMAEKPSFGMPACASTFTGRAHNAAWTIPAGVAAHTYALTQGVVDFGTKRRTATGTTAWRPSDC